MVLRRSAITFGTFTSTLAHVLEKRRDTTLTATCGTACLVPASYGACPKNDAVCLCSDPTVVQDVANCVIRACTDQDDLESTIMYMYGVCQSYDVTSPIPSTLQTLIPSTRISSTPIPTTLVPPPATVVEIPTMTLPELILPTSTSTPPGPTLAATAGAVTGTIAAIFILVVAFICWRRRNKRTRRDRLRRGESQGGIAGWRTPVRATTVESLVAGKEESDDPSTGLLSKKKTQRFWTSPGPSDSRVGYTGLAARVTMLVPREYQQIPPQPPPSHLKPVPRAAGPATPASSSGRPFDSPSHSPSGSYYQYYRYYYGISPTNSIPSTAVSISTPFSPVKPSTAWDGNTPPSSASIPGAQEEQCAAWGGGGLRQKAVYRIHPLHRPVQTLPPRTVSSARVRLEHLAMDIGGI